MSHLNEGASGVRNSSKLKILIINFFTLFVKKATKIVTLAQVPKRMTMTKSFALNGKSGLRETSTTC